MAERYPTLEGMGSFFAGVTDGLYMVAFVLYALAAVIFIGLIVRSRILGRRRGEPAATAPPDAGSDGPHGPDSGFDAPGPGVSGPEGGPGVSGPEGRET